VNISIKRITKDRGVQIEWADGTTQFFSNLAEVKQWSKDVDEIETLRKLAVAWWLIRDKTAASAATIERKVVTLDLASDVPFEVR
jgi:hypothetical protein